MQDGLSRLEEKVKELINLLKNHEEHAGPMSQIYKLITGIKKEESRSKV